MISAETLFAILKLEAEKQYALAFFKAPTSDYYWHLNKWLDEHLSFVDLEVLSYILLEPFMKFPRMNHCLKTV